MLCKCQPFGVAFGVTFGLAFARHFALARHFTFARHFALARHFTFAGHFTFAQCSALLSSARLLRFLHPVVRWWRRIMTVAAIATQPSLTREHPNR